MAKHLVVGMSHIESLRKAWRDMDDAERAAADLDFINVTAFRDRRAGTIDTTALNAAIDERVGPDTRILFSFGGNEHNIIGLCEIEPLAAASRTVEARVRSVLRRWFGTVTARGRGACLLLPPPPNGSEPHIRAHPGTFRKVLSTHPVRNAGDRLRLWSVQCDATREFARAHGLDTVEPPADMRAEDGCLHPDAYGADPTHGNARYGLAVLRRFLDGPGDDGTARHPYAALPDYAYWRKAVANVAPGTLDPVVRPRFRIRPGDRVATAGSCFAQHISKRLRSGGFRFLAVEPGSVADAAAAGEASPGYDFSARYGNIYTARQLAQLFDRAFGYFRPLDGAWPLPGGRYCDPFRPRIEPDGFASEAEVARDRRRHLAAVRRMFRGLDVFVFTLGLTECWLSRLDGAAYPVAPGVAGGRYDPARHAFVNFSVAEVVADLGRFLAGLRQVNPAARVILTVSPVPLVATHEERHVLLSTVYSKSVLRVAAQEVRALHDNVEYFPSYELINGPHSSSRYFGEDCRSIRDEGVDHVMRVFMASMTESMAGPAAAAYRAVEVASDAACDEELYGPPAER